MIVAILSPSTSSVDQVTKAQVYARYGVPCYWVVDPEGKTLDEFRLERVPTCRCAAGSNLLL
ncbi:Uma2 family endonuclease [Desulfofundulus thermocisternus]|uniref:Uma2 family endonuclease n=1 Tax=Desulfofundulus thermocisternus TaxID=42471 RepID=UPI0019F61478|nr:Uma2 family endonuclease [Desulfofundulus thermocisternus]MBE3586838.1 Uma2 family endonuclease [Thermoanaerobacter sp.]